MPESKTFSPTPDPRLWVTILAGGAGTRFWPASTPRRPKPLLPLGGEEPLILETYRRALSVSAPERIRVLASDPLVEPLATAIGNVPPGSFLVEPEPKGTGPALVWAAWELSRLDPDAVLISLHADHAIAPLTAFQRLALDAGAVAKESSRLFLVAVPPDRPETGFGYVEPGPVLETGTARAFREVRSFVEKPDRGTAEKYLRRGYLWNSGIFIWRAGAFLDEVRAVSPELAPLLAYLEQGKPEKFFKEAPTISVDEAVLERSRKVAFIEADFAWDDLGSWEALHRTREKDAEGNVVWGRVHRVAASGNIAYADAGDVVLFGVDDLVVVRSGEIVLVTDRQHCSQLKDLLRELPPALRDPGVP